MSYGNGHGRTNGSGYGDSSHGNGDGNGQGNSYPYCGKWTGDGAGNGEPAQHDVYLVLDANNFSFASLMINTLCRMQRESAS